MRLTVLLLLLLGSTACTTRAIRNASIETQARPDDPDAWVALGDALAEAARPLQAQQAYNQAVSLDPDHAIARERADQVQGGASRLERRAMRNPMDDEIWGDLGDHYALLGRDEDAKRAYQRAYRLDPEDSEWQGALRGLGEEIVGLDGEVVANDEALGDQADVLRAMNRWEEACDLYRQAAAIDPGDSEWTQWVVTCDVGAPGLGVSMEGAGVEALEGRLREDLRLLVALAEAHAKAGDRDEAAGYLRSALLLDPADRDTLAMYLAITGRDARSVLTDLADETARADAAGALGDHLLGLGDPAGARTAWERAAELSEDGDRWTRRLDLLDRRDPEE